MTGTDVSIEASDASAAVEEVEETEDEVDAAEVVDSAGDDMSMAAAGVICTSIGAGVGWCCGEVGALQQLPVASLPVVRFVCLFCGRSLFTARRGEWSLFVRGVDLLTGDDGADICFFAAFFGAAVVAWVRLRMAISAGAAVQGCEMFRWRGQRSGVVLSLLGCATVPLLSDSCSTVFVC